MMVFIYQLNLAYSTLILQAIQDLSAPNIAAFIFFYVSSLLL